MINQECFTKKWCETVAKKLNYNDIQLIEKVVRALSLLELAYADNGGESYILLDVLYEYCHYQNTMVIPIDSPFIESPFIEIDGEPLMVNVPSVGDILGDKLTEFAPNTTGI